MPKRATRKNKHAKGKTVSEIRKTLDTIDKEFQDSLKVNTSLEDRVRTFMKKWKAKVGKEISYKMAKEYVELRLRSKRRKTVRRNHRGGMAPLAGATLDYTTRPGGYETHGQFLPYVNNDIRGFWSSGISADCGKVDTTPIVPLSIGSNKVSGGGPILSSFLAPFTALNLRIPMTSPPSVGNDFAAGLNGRPLPGSFTHATEVAAPLKVDNIFSPRITLSSL